MSTRSSLRFLRIFIAAACTLATLSFAAVAQTATTRYTPPQGLLAGMTATDKVDATALLRIVIELEPMAPGLETLAAATIDPANPQHRTPLTREAFIARFARSQADVEKLAALLW